MSHKETTPIAGYDGKYEITIDGHIWSNVGKGMWRKNTVAPIGYKVITLRKKGKTHVVYIHRLLAETFIENPDNKQEVNHIDGDKLNNSIDNLEWSTRKENMRHAFRTGLADNRGSKQGLSKLSDSKVISIREKSLLGTSNKKLAIDYGVAPSTISSIVTKRNWSWL